MDPNNSASSSAPTVKIELDTAPARKIGIAERFGVLLPLVAWVLLMIVFSVLNRHFLTGENMMNIVRQSSVLLVVAMAGTFVIMLGSIDLSVGSVLTLGGIITAMAVTKWGDWAILLVLVVCFGAGAVAGLLNAYAKLPSFLATLGLLFVWQGFGYIISGGVPKNWNSSLIMSLMGGNIHGFPVVGIWALVIFLVCVFIGRGTRFGRYLIAIGDGERVARMSGVPVDRIKLIAFAVAGLLSGLAGILLAVRAVSGTVGMGDSFMLDSIAAIVLGGTALTGGVGGPQRTIFGVLVIVTLSNGMVIAGVDPFWQIVIRGAVVIAAVAMTTRRTKGMIAK